MGLIAAVLAREMHSLLIGESANEKDRTKIEELIQECKGISQVIEIRTQHLGPEEILIGARVVFDESLQAKEIAVIINDLEETINTEVKDAGPIFIEPEILDSN